MDSGIGITLGFLLPAGVWLMVTAASPRAQENHAAASGFLAIAISTLAFFAFGFAFLSGGVGATLGLKQYPTLSTYQALPLGGQMWGLVGTRGFGLANAGINELLLCLTYLPLAQTAALLMVAALYRHIPYPAQALAAVLAGGVVAPIAGFWVWGGGWLAQLGAGASLGHGAVDLNGLTLVGLVAGGMSAVWLTRAPRAEPSRVLPQAGFPMRVFAGIALVFVGQMAFAATSPLLKNLGAGGLAGFGINAAAGMAGGALAGMAYALFVSRRADALLGARCALAALIAIAAGGATLPLSVALAVGVALGILVPVADYAIKHATGLPDDEFSIASVFISALIGMILPGLFAQGNLGAGWNGVGAEQYLGARGLGISGIFGAVATPDIGQLSAQIIAILTTSALGGATSLAFARLFKPRSLPQFEEDPQPIPARLRREEVEQAYVPPQEQMALLPETPDEQPELAMPAVSNKAAARAEGSILARLREMQAQRNKPAAPAQARKVAYPTRVGGKRLFTRPVAEEKKS